MIRLLTVLAIMTLVACVTGSSSGSSADEDVVECRTGLLSFLPGPSPLPVLSLDGVHLILDESTVKVPASLEGAELEVCGSRATQNAPNFERLLVHSFDLLTIGGERAFMGTLLLRDGEPVLTSPSRDWRLTGPVERLLAHVEKRIWVVGQVGTESIRVQSYGLVDP